MRRCSDCTSNARFCLVNIQNKWRTFILGINGLIEYPQVTEYHFELIVARQDHVFVEFYGSIRTAENEIAVFLKVPEAALNGQTSVLVLWSSYGMSLRQDRRWTDRVLYSERYFLYHQTIVYRYYWKSRRSCLYDNV